MKVSAYYAQRLKCMRNISVDSRKAYLSRTIIINDNQLLVTINYSNRRLALRPNGITNEKFLWRYL